MTVSLFDLLTIGIGPSSSHTVGPMEAAADFAQLLRERGLLHSVRGLRVDLYGSLAATGHGHGTLGAVLLGLEGNRSRTVQPETISTRLAELEVGAPLRLGGDGPQIQFGTHDITLRPLTVLKRHPNAVRFTALREPVMADVSHDAPSVLLQRTSYSVGGGFVVHEDEETHIAPDGALPSDADEAPLPYPFANNAELMAHCSRTELSVAEVAFANETALRSPAEVERGIAQIWKAMEECMNSGLRRTGPLPGGLGTRRRAPAWHARLLRLDPHQDVAYWLEWVNLVALAVNEENASGGRVVTAPTNGAAGVLPAVLFYATHYTERAQLARQTDGEASSEGPAWLAIVTEFLLAASAIGSVIKQQASISGAEVGCQGEVGSASAMAAAGLAQVLGGTPQQVSNAAEIAMEHHLGLTCDPVGGLVQVPCIERNAIAAGTAVNAARMALFEESEPLVTLDQVVRTMKETGADMSDKYKETAQGGLAVNLPEC